MPNNEHRIYELLLQTLLNERQIAFKHWERIHVYTQANFHGQLKIV